MWGGRIETCLSFPCELEKKWTVTIHLINLGMLSDVPHNLGYKDAASPQDEPCQEIRLNSVERLSRALPGTKIPSHQSSNNRIPAACNRLYIFISANECRLYFRSLHVLLRRKQLPTPVFLLRESHAQRSLQAAVHRVAQSQT